MLRVLVSVQLDHEDERDLEVPAEVPISQLASLIVGALKSRIDNDDAATQYIIRATPPGRLLRPDESLAAAAVWDGAALSIQTITTPYFIAASGRRYPCLQTTMRLGRLGSDSKTQPLPTDLIHLGEETNGNTVSRNHAVLSSNQGRWLLTPTAQAGNQTLLNGQPLATDKQYDLQNGDHVQLGGVELYFIL